MLRPAQNRHFDSPCTVLATNSLDGQFDRCTLAAINARKTQSCAVMHVMVAPIAS